MKNMHTKGIVRTKYNRPIPWVGLFFNQIIDIYPKLCYHIDNKHIPKTNKEEMIICQDLIKQVLRAWDL